METNAGKYDGVIRDMYTVYDEIRGRTGKYDAVRDNTMGKSGKS